MSSKYINGAESVDFLSLVRMAMKLHKVLKLVLTDYQRHKTIKSLTFSLCLQPDDFPYQWTVKL